MKVVASLSESGWLTDPYKILDSIVSYYILSDGMQSFVFKDAVINLPNTYYQHINDPDSMAIKIKSDLVALLSRYFPSCDVSTYAKDMGNGEYAVILYASIMTEDGSNLDIARVVEINSSKTRKVITVNNYGDAVSYLNGL